MLASLPHGRVLRSQGLALQLLPIPTEDLTRSEAMSDIQRPNIARDHGDRQPGAAVRRFRIAAFAPPLRKRYPLLKLFLFARCLNFPAWLSRSLSHFGAGAVAIGRAANVDSHKISSRQSKPVALIPGAIR